MTETTMCGTNIGMKGKRRRFILGLGVLAGVAAAVALGLPHDWRLALVLPIWFACLCIVQALAGT